MSRGSVVALLGLLALAGCTTKAVDPWSAATLLTHLSDTQTPLACVPDPLLYLRTLRPELERLGPMPAAHACQKDRAECLAQAGRDFCGSALAEKLEAESRDFKTD